MQESKQLVQESISGGKIWNRKSMPVKEKFLAGKIFVEFVFGGSFFGYMFLAGPFDIIGWI